MSKKRTPEKEDINKDDLKTFIQKRKKQNEVLKKIIEQINNDKKNNNTRNSTIH